MTYEEAKLFLDGEEEGDSDDDYLSAKGTGTEKFLRGLQILARYNNEDIVGGSEHDILYLCDHPEAMTKEEIKELSTLGFHLDSEGECWAMFT